MTIGELILIIAAITLNIILGIRFKRSGEENFIDYIFNRGVLQYLVKSFSLIYIFVVYFFLHQRMLFTDKLGFFKS